MNCHKHYFKYFLVAVTVAVLLSIGHPSPSVAQDAPISNLTDGCVENYDAAVDYFPDKVEIEYAEGFSVEYFNHYKVVSSTLPFTEETIEYVLVQCGTPAPDGFEDAQIIQVPIESIITLSTTQLPHLAALGEVDSLIGIDSFLYTNTPEVIERINIGAVTEMGFASEMNVELIVDAEADLVVTDGFSDAFQVLAELGVPSALNTEWVENTPLARAEWLKFTAVFYNQEVVANDVFGEVAADYQDLVSLIDNIPTDQKPRVLYGTFLSWTNAWNLPGEESYISQFFRDAGGLLVLEDDTARQDTSNSVPYDFEVVFDAGFEADYWITDAFGVNTLNDLIAQNELYAELLSVQNGDVFNTNGRQNENGGSDYYESAVIYPNLVLADLVSIFYPELLPEHELVYLKPLR